MIQNNEIPSILKSVGSGASAGFAIGGPVGAAIGGVVGGAASALAKYHNDPIKVYKTMNSVENATPYQGVFQGMPAATRQKEARVYTKENPKGKRLQTISDVIDTASTAVTAFDGFRKPDLGTQLDSSKKGIVDYSKLFGVDGNDNILYQYGLPSKAEDNQLIPDKKLSPLPFVPTFAQRMEYNREINNFNWDSIMKNAKSNPLLKR